MHVYARLYVRMYVTYVSKVKGIPVQAWTGPGFSSSLELPDFMTVSTCRWYTCQLYAPAAFRVCQ